MGYGECGTWRVTYVRTGSRKKAALQRRWSFAISFVPVTLFSLISSRQRRRISLNPSPKNNMFWPGYVAFAFVHDLINCAYPCFFLGLAVLVAFSPRCHHG